MFVVGCMCGMMCLGVVCCDVFGCGEGEGGGGVAVGEGVLGCSGAGLVVVGCVWVLYITNVLLTDPEALECASYHLCVCELFQTHRK